MNCGRAITFVSTLPTMAAAGLLSAVPYSFGGWTSRAWTHERDYDIVIFEHYRPGAWFRADI